jgi:hypothetical protein
MEKILENNKTTAFLITFFLFAISYLTIGWWTDSYQHMYDTAISGELTDYYMPSAHNPFPEYMPGAAYFFNLLGKLYPIRWIAFFLNTILFVSIWILYYQILKYSKEYPPFSKFLVILFFALLFLESIVLYHMVRITMFAGIAALSGIITSQNNKVFTWKNLLFLSLFIVALWIRNNVHLFVLTFITGAFILHKKSIKPLLPFWIAFFLFFAHFCSIVFIPDHKEDLNSFFLYNTEFKLQHQGEYTPDLILKTKEDTIKYNAIQQFILADEIHLPPSYYEEIGLFTNLSKFSYSHAQYAFGQFLGSMSENLHFILADLLLIVFYLVFGGALLKNYQLKTIGLFVFFYAIVLAISFIKMENRFLVPFQVLFLFTIIVLHQPKVFSEKKFQIIFFAFLIGVSVFSYDYIMNKVEYERTNTTYFKKGMEYLKSDFSNNILVYNTGFVTKNRPYEVFYQKNDFKKFYVYNYYGIHLSKWYRPYLEKDCNCSLSNLNSFYEYLYFYDPETVFLESDRRVKPLNDFLQFINNSNLVLSPYIDKSLSLDIIENLGFDDDMNVFQLKSR